MPILSLLITILIFCLVAGVLLWAARALLGAFKVPQPFATIAYVAVVLILLFLFLSEVGWVGSAHGWRTWH